MERSHNACAEVPDPLQEPKITDVQVAVDLYAKSAKLMGTMSKRDATVPSWRWSGLAAFTRVDFYANHRFISK
jgi:hypothetical protein